VVYSIYVPEKMMIVKEHTKCWHEFCQSHNVCFWFTLWKKCRIRQHF